MSTTVARVDLREKHISPGEARLECGPSTFGFTTAEKLIGVPTDIACEIAYKVRKSGDFRESSENAANVAKNYALCACVVSASEWFQFILRVVCTLSIYLFVSMAYACQRKRLVVESITNASLVDSETGELKDGRDVLTAVPVLQCQEYAAHADFVRFVLQRVEEERLLDSTVSTVPSVDIDNQGEFTRTMALAIGDEFSRVGIKNETYSPPHSVTLDNGTEVALNSTAEVLLWGGMHAAFCNRHREAPHRRNDYFWSGALKEFSSDWEFGGALNPFTTSEKLSWTLASSYGYLSYADEPTNSQWGEFIKKMGQLRMAMQALATFTKKRNSGEGCERELKILTFRLNKFLGNRCLPQSRPSAAGDSLSKSALTLPSGTSSWLTSVCGR